MEFGGKGFHSMAFESNIYDQNFSFCITASECMDLAKMQIDRTYDIAKKFLKEFQQVELDRSRRNKGMAESIGWFWMHLAEMSLQESYDKVWQGSLLAYTHAEVTDLILSALLSHSAPRTKR